MLAYNNKLKMNNYEITPIFYNTFDNDCISQSGSIPEEQYLTCFGYKDIKMSKDLPEMFLNHELDLIRRVSYDQELLTRKDSDPIIQTRPLRPDHPDPSTQT